MADMFRFRLLPTGAGPTVPPLAVDGRCLDVMLRDVRRTVLTWDAAGKLPAPMSTCGLVTWLPSTPELRTDCLNTDQLAPADRQREVSHAR